MEYALNVKGKYANVFMNPNITQNMILSMNSRSARAVNIITLKYVAVVNSHIQQIMRKDD